MRLKELRKQHNYTQEKVAELLGISRGAYTNIENGKREPDLKTLAVLSDLYSVSIGFLVGKEDFLNGRQMLKKYIDKRLNGLSYQEFAKQNNIDYRVMELIEFGPTAIKHKYSGDLSHQKTSLSTGDLEALANALGVDFLYLFCLYDGYNPHRVSNVKIPPDDITPPIADNEVLVRHEPLINLQAFGDTSSNPTSDIRFAKSGKNGGLTTDGFTYAMQNEGKTLTEEDQNLLIALAKQLNNAKGEKEKE